MSSKSDIIRELDKKYGVLTSSPSYDSIESYKESIGAGKGKNYENNLVKTQNKKGVNAQASTTNEDSGKAVSDLKREQDERQKETIDVDAAKSKYEQTQKEYDEKLSLDLDAYSQEIAALEQQLEDYEPEFNWEEDKYRDLNPQQVADAEIQRMQEEIDRRKQYLTLAQRVQEKARLSSVADSESENYDPYFEELSRYLGSDHTDKTYEYINNQSSREQLNREQKGYGSNKYRESSYESAGYDYMSEDEVRLYNYYYSKGGAKSAQAYLDTIQEELNQRKATGMYQKIKGQTGKEMLFGVGAGFDQFESGVKGAARAVKGDDSYVAPSATQYASGMVREDLADDGFKLPAWLGGASLGQVGFDAITTTANMAPSILGSVAANFVLPGSGAVVGNALLGGSAAGSAYQEKINEGYSVEQARKYGAAIGASEIALNYALGGISDLGGVLTNHAIGNALKSVENGILQAVIQIGGSVGSEALEEGIQEVLTPIFSNLLLNTDESIDWGQVAYSAIMGALTGGVFEGHSIISDISQQSSQGREVKSAKGVETMKEMGQTSSDSVTRDLANRISSSKQDQKNADIVAATQAQPVTATETAAQTATAQPAMAAQVTQDTQTAQPQKTETQQQGQKKLEVSDIVAAITGKAQETGTVSNKDANQILTDPEVVATLEQESGRTIDGTNSEKRSIIKEIVRNIAQQNTTQEATQQPQMETQQTVQTTEAPQTQRTEQPVSAAQEAQQVRTQSTDTQAEEESVSVEGGQQEDARELQRDRVNAVREQGATVTDKDGRTVTEFAGNAYQSSLTPDSFTDSIKRLVDEGQVSHDVQTNEESLKKGAELIAAEGSERNAVNKLRDMANSGKTSAEYIAMGTLLYQDLTTQIETQSQNGKVDPNLQQDAEDVFVSLSKLATNSGRALQLFNLYRKMSPDSQVNVLKKEVQSEVESLQKRGIVKKGYQTSIDPELTQMYRDAVVEYQRAKTDSAKTAAETKMQEIQNVIYASEAAKMPTTFKAKWDAWRYMAMLGNAKTQIRNVVGNAVMMPYTEAKRVVGSALESAVIKDKSQRTKSVVSVITDGELLSWAKEDAKSGAVKDILSGTTKTSDTAKGIVEENLQTFGDSWAGKKLNTLQKKIGDVTQAGDFIFKSNEYSRSLASFLKARGYTATDAKTDGGIPTDVMNEARNYAIEEAARATFNDSNVVSDWFSSIGRKDDSNVIAKAANILMEGVIPFRKTPANVLVRGWEYSPMGVLTTIGKTAVDIKNGEYSAATAVDRVAANLTGTAAFALGIALANGLGNVKLVGGNADEDEERQGHQKYSLEITTNGETYSYTIDWAAPANLPLFMGANLVETLNNPSTESLLSAVADVGLNTLEPMLELSCLSGLNDFLEAGRYAEEGGVSGTLLAKAATSYITQGIPSLLRQASQASQETKQTTFTTSGDNAVKSLQRTAAGIPFAGSEYQTDKLNEWGEKEETGNKTERIINAFINPGTYKKVESSELEQEIARLNDAQEINVSPDSFPKTVSYTDQDGTYHKDHRLTEEEYQKYAQTQGQTAKAILEDMINSKTYEAMDDEQKAKAWDMVYSYAKEKATVETFGTDYGSSWMMGIKDGKAAEQILSRTASNAISNAVSSLDNAWDNGYSKENTERYSSALEEVYNSYKAMPELKRYEIKDTATGTAAKYIEARDKGISHDAIVSVFKSVNSMDDPDQHQKLETVAKSSNLTEAQKVTVAKLYATDAQDKNIDEVKKLGGSYKTYTELYRDHSNYTSGNGKKNRTISHWMDKYGWDYSTAKKYYEVFS